MQPEIIQNHQNVIAVMSLRSKTFPAHLVPQEIRIPVNNLQEIHMTILIIHKKEIHITQNR